MEYKTVTLGTFVARPNRFLAHVELDGRVEVCHLKNTSRLTELLVPGTQTAVQKAENPLRKTGFDVIAVQHAGRWVNIDSQAPNKVFLEWVQTGGYFGSPTLIRPETTWGHSRFDYYIETGGRKIFVEIKGVTLVEDGVARFPGAPTVRGTKHVRELAQCLQDGYEAMVVFIIKRDDVKACGPNDALDPAFGKALRGAVKEGVKPLALDCHVTAGSLTVRGPVEILL